MISVAHIVAHPPFREGTGTVCYYNARALRALGCQVRVYVPERAGAEIDPQLYHPMRRWLTIENAFLTPALLSIPPADIYHLHLPFIFGAELTLLRSFARSPLIVTYHNDLIGGGVRKPLFFLYNLLNTPLLLKLARKIIVVSHDHAQASRFGSTILRQRTADVVEISNGVDTEHFRPDIDGTSVRQQHHLDKKNTVVLFVGALDRAHAIKGLDVLLAALAQIDDEQIKLLIVGDGDDRETYERQAIEYGLTGRVIFTGRIAHNILPRYYAAADIVAIPARAESFGLALAEGMAAGKAVIGGNTPGARLVIRDGETGFLVNPDDRAGLVTQLCRLARDPHLRALMGRQGQRHIANHYSWQRTAEQLVTLYQKVLGHE